MKKLLKIGLVLLVVGICLAALGRAFGGTFDYEVNPKTHEFIDGRDEGSYYVEDSMSLDAFTALDIHVGAADVDIREGDAYHLDYIMYREDRPTISTKGGTLVIKSKEEQSYHFGVNFEFVEFGWNAEKRQPRLIVTIPKGTKLSAATILTESGDLELANISSDQISIRSESGDISLTGIDCSTMDVTLESGDAKVKECSFHSHKLLSESGDVIVTDVNCSDMDMTLESGDVRISECDFGSLTLLSESGDVKMEEVLVDNLEAKAESGDVRVSLKGNQEEYGFDLSCESGDVILDRRNQGENFVYMVEKEKLIKIKNESGDVQINFE